MSKPSILIVHNQYVTHGGEERLVDQQIQLFRSRGHDVYTYGADSALFARGSVFQKALAGLQTPFSFTHYRALRRHLQDLRPSLMHVHNIFPLLTPSVYYAAAAEGVPIVQSVHNYRFLCSNGLFLLPDGAICERCLHGAHWNAVRFGCAGGSRLRSAAIASTLLLHRALRTLPRKVGAFITTSEFLRQKLIAGGLPENRIHRLPPYFKPFPQRSRPAGKRTLLYVGRLSREKGLWTLLQAAAFLPEWSIHIVGQGPMEDELRAAVNERHLSNITFGGKIAFARLQELYQEATLLVVPSECYENLPTVILEAWFYGTPVIASRLGGMAEVIQEGLNGQLFTPGDARALAHTVRSAEKPEILERLRHSIPGHFEKHYSDEISYRQLAAVYDRILARSEPLPRTV